MSEIENKKKLFITSATVLSIILVTYYLYVLNLSDKIYQYYWMTNTKIVGYVMIALTLSLFILLFFSNDVFNKWLKRFFYWYGPLSAILILSGSTTSSYTWFSRADLAIFFGTTLVAVTLVFALVQKFIYKK